MHLRHTWLLVATAVSALWWLLGAAGNLQTAHDLLAERGLVLSMIGAIISSPVSGAVCTCLCVLVYGGLHAYDRLLVRPRLEFAIRVQQGVMRLPGISNRPTADIVIDNSGAPFELVAHAKLVESPDGKAVGQGWEYRPRPVHGGVGSSWFHIATVRVTDFIASAILQQTGRQIEIHGEDMAVIHHWEAKATSRLVLEWKFFALRSQTNYPIGECVVSVRCSPDLTALIPEIVSSRIMP